MRSTSFTTFLLSMASLTAHAGTLASFRIEPAVSKVRIWTEDRREIDDESKRIDVKAIGDATILRTHLIDGRYTIEATEAGLDLSSFTLTTIGGEVRIFRMGSRQTGRTLELLHAEDAPENTLFRSRPVGTTHQVPPHLRTPEPAGFVEVSPYVVRWGLENSKAELWLTYPGWDHGVMVRVKADPDRYFDHWSLETRDGARWDLHTDQMVVKVPAEALAKIELHAACAEIILSAPNDQSLR